MKIRKEADVSLKEAFEVLRAHAVEQGPPKEAEFKHGDAVLIDGDPERPAIVYSVDDEGATSVYFFNEDGLVAGPSFGWELEKYKEGGYFE